MKNTFAKQGYLNVLIWVSQQQHFTNKDLLLHYPVSKSLIYDMNNLGYIKKVATATYKWNLDRNPTLSDVAALRGKVNRHNRLTKKQGKQLTIQPIKSIQRPVPQSIIELNEKILEYPILDVAIAFLAGMVVAAFFTLIWN